MEAPDNILRMKDGTVTMELWPNMTEMMKEFLNCEVEMLQGTTQPLDDGRIKHTFSLSGEKADLCRQFCMFVNLNFHLISKN